MSITTLHTVNITAIEDKYVDYFSTAYGEKMQEIKKGCIDSASAYRDGFITEIAVFTEYDDAVRCERKLAIYLGVS